VLAFGDSITNGGGELQWGVALQSWALWVARGLGLPFTGFAVDGAFVSDVVSLQIPACLARSPAGARYEVGCLYIGVNDVRSVDWDPASFEALFRTALRFLVDRCDRVVAVTAPLDLGRPRAGAKVGDLDEVIVSVAADLGALVVDLRSWGARNLVMTDHVHPTAFGQIDIAQRALSVLARDGMRVVVAPASLISYSPSRWERLRGDWTYAYRHLKVSAGSGALRGRVALRARLGPPGRLALCARLGLPGRVALRTRLGPPGRLALRTRLGPPGRLALRGRLGSLRARRGAGSS
jgi:GDSL-like Lipase/Acylhydrolase family